VLKVASTPWRSGRSSREGTASCEVVAAVRRSLPEPLLSLLVGQLCRTRCWCSRRGKAGHVGPARAARQPGQRHRIAAVDRIVRERLDEKVVPRPRRVDQAPRRRFRDEDRDYGHPDGGRVRMAHAARSRQEALL